MEYIKENYSTHSVGKSVPLCLIMSFHSNSIFNLLFYIKELFDFSKPQLFGAAPVEFFVGKDKPKKTPSKCPAVLPVSCSKTRPQVHLILQNLLAGEKFVNLIEKWLRRAATGPFKTSGRVSVGPRPPVWPSWLLMMQLYLVWG